mmetsp:Transcript_11406/g.26311  ORF Transcript_11406/g.26311 Transcript_11406/m.26311 type:complete len:523 (-) Transcript_11406:67-1635(-)
MEVAMRTRTPRMARTIKPGEGVLAWKAYRDRQNKDLLHRTEYLTSIVSAVAEIEVPAGEDLRAALNSDTARNAVGITNEAYSWCAVDDGASWSGMALRPEKRRFRRTAWPQEVLPQKCHAMNMASSARFCHQPSWQAVSGEMAPAEVFNRAGYDADALKGHQTVQDVCRHISTMLESLPRSDGQVQYSKAQHRINTNSRKAKPVPGIHEDAFREDHQSTALFHQQKKISAQRVVRVSEADQPEPNMEMNFMRFFTALMYNEAQQPSADVGFTRLDGLEAGSLHKFSILEGGMCVRRESRLPRFTMPPALVVSMQPAEVFQCGHYFEVSVQSLFQSISPADRPLIAESRGRSAGVILGFRAARPLDEDEPADDVTKVSHSWCLSSNGFFFMQAGSPSASIRQPVTQTRATPEVRPSWHRKKPLPGEIGMCPWPPPPRGNLVKQCDWSVALTEGDTLGLLALPSGALLLTVNGRRALAVIDAGVPTDRVLFPLVQVGNHVKAVKLRAKAVPPMEDGHKDENSGA